MKRKSSDLNMVMTSSRAGARAVRSRRSLWRKALLFILPLISLFSLVVYPATSAFAAYGTSFSGTFTYQNLNVSNYYIESGALASDTAFQYVAYGTLTLNISWNDQNLYSDGKIMSMFVQGLLSPFAPTVTGWNSAHSTIEIISISYDTEFRDLGFEQFMFTDGRNQFRAYVSTVNQRQYIGVNVSFKVHTSFSKDITVSANDRSKIETYAPTVQVSSLSNSGEYISISDLNPDLRDLKNSLVGSNGWMSTINTNLQSLVTQQNTTNSWLNTQSGQLTQCISHLAGVRANQQTQIYNESTIISNQNTQIAKQETQISQLQEIVDYINNTEAASVVDEANDTFTDQAAAMESGQAALEEDADDNIDAVDVAGNLAVVTTYRQSLNFWMRCVNYLPTATGSIWEAFVFGVFLAFILFILRLNK